MIRSIAPAAARSGSMGSILTSAGVLAPTIQLPSAYQRCAVEFRVLGPVEVIHGGRAFSVGGARTRAVLAMLLLNANRVVSADRLAGELWPDLGPERAAANLQVRLAELRRALRSAGAADRLVTRPPGYVFLVAVGELDVSRFE